MAATLKFTVEVAADQATAALKALSVASNQAGVAMKTSMATVGTTSRQAAGGLMELKTAAGRARETAMFFTQSLGEFGPQGRTAQIAISGIAGAIMGGGGILIALSLAQAAVRLLVDAWKEEAEAEEKARKEAEETAKKQREIALERVRGFTDYRDKLAQSNADLRLELQGRSSEEIAYLTEVKRLKTEMLQLDGAQLALAKKRLAELEELAQKNKLLRGQLELQEKIKKAAEDKANAKAKALAGSQTGAQGASGYEEEGARMGEYQALKAADYKKAQDAYNDSVRQSIALQQQWGAAIGQVFAKMATGQMTMQEAVAQIGQMVIQQVVQTAIAQVTANAASAGSGAAASQAGIPVVGPVLAISAMGAVMASVLGLLGSIPSARGGWWDTGAYEGLAMVHKKEMILPAGAAETVRRGAGGITLNVAAYDANGFGRVLSNNQSALSRELRKLQRRGSI